MYYAKIAFLWAGEYGFTPIHQTQTTEGADTPAQASADAWDYIDEYMRMFPEGGYQARFWVVKRNNGQGQKKQGLLLKLREQAKEKALEAIKREYPEHSILTVI